MPVDPRMLLKRAALALILAVPLAGLAGASAAPGEDGLYRAKAIVTGQRPETRHGGLVDALRSVLAKVSGDPRLLDDPRVAAMAERAETFVVGIGYRDRMAGKPLADEQGTRDRPHDLIVDFDPHKIDAALEALGRTPWTGVRPHLVAFIRMHNGTTAHLLARDTDGQERQRIALGLAAERFGVPVSLPNGEVLAASGLTELALTDTDPRRLDAAARDAGGDLALVGVLTWSDEAPGWISDWRFASDGRVHRWTHRGGGFDEAFRLGVGGVAQILSGNARPE